MIIAVSSAPIVDTSAAVQALSRRYGLEIHEDPAQEICLQYGFQTIYDMPPDLQRHVREHLIRSHLNCVSHNDDLLLNYSVVEWLADWMRWFWSSTPTQFWAKIMEIATVSVRRYDAVYHLENNADRRYNGYVWLDKENSRQINSIMKHLYMELDIAKKVHYEVD